MLGGGTQFVALDLRELTATVGVDAFLDTYVKATAAYTRLSPSSVDVLSVQAGGFYTRRYLHRRVPLLPGVFRGLRVGCCKPNRLHALVSLLGYNEKPRLSSLHMLKAAIKGPQRVRVRVRVIMRVHLEPDAA